MQFWAEFVNDETFAVLQSVKNWICQGEILNGNRQDVLRFVKKERHVERNGEKFVASTYVVVTQLDCWVDMVDIMVFQYGPGTCLL